MSATIILDPKKLSEKLGTIHIYVGTLQNHSLLNFKQTHMILKELCFCNKNLRYCFYLNYHNQPLPDDLVPQYEAFIEQTVTMAGIRDTQLLHFELLEAIYRSDLL